MSDSFNILTDADKRDISYGACVAGSALIGAGVGRFLGLQGLLAGAGAGLVIGLMACPKLQEPIKRKIFSQNARLTDQELTQAMAVVRSETPVTSKSDAMYLLGVARQQYASNPGAFDGRRTSVPPLRSAAQQLLANKGRVRG